ncbi:hypothetical protein BV25DRAFT_1829123 [Artomyces pyxidatus]|uniref:Uncharacterized protein n=1 Tax=Artomyces pyxidatus TaxID=48021 RepID=A0ACB8STA4_9AGAM|nr:hypothetical protein BV25DRAFT_1829123 [Artomyces pyxidatus]
MGWHHFYTLNLDQEAYYFGEELFDYICTPTARDLIWFLAMPSWRGTPNILREARAAVTIDSSRKSSLGTLQLPAELLLMIFDQLDDLADLTHLAICHSTLLRVGRRHVYNMMCAAAAMWAGDRLICLGLDDPRMSGKEANDDLPQGMLSPEERRDWLSTQQKFNRSPDENVEDATDEISLRNFAITAFDNMGCDRFRPPRFLNKLDGLDERIARSLLKPLYPKTGWVLCNYSKGLFVRADAIAKLTGWEEVGPKPPGRIGLCEALISQIAWSANRDEWVGLGDADKVMRGPWAGDRFAIRNTYHGFRLDAQGWMDVTEEVLEHLTGMWKAHYGEKWKEELWKKQAPPPPEPILRFGKGYF